MQMYPRKLNALILIGVGVLLMIASEPLHKALIGMSSWVMVIIVFLNPIGAIFLVLGVYRFATSSNLGHQLPQGRGESISSVIQQMETRMEQKHSLLGIASFIISIAAGGSTIFWLFLQTMGHGKSLIVFLFIVISLCVDFVAFAIGIAGLIQKEKKKVFAKLGATFSLATIVVTIALYSHWG